MSKSQYEVSKIIAGLHEQREKRQMKINEMKAHVAGLERQITSLEDQNHSTTKDLEYWLIELVIAVRKLDNLK